MLIIIICLFVNLSKAYGAYSKWCSAEELFKPYITIYEHRHGNEISSGGPTFYPTDHYSNIYVCINGPAWLYFARHSAIGDVYHKPEFRVYQHECQAFNGRPGPGNYTDPLILMGVYLLGVDEDYRLPSIHLFTAPLYNNVTGVYENTTSVMTINNKQCTIIKGKDTILTVDPRPTEKYSYCKIPYQEIDIIYTTPATPTEDAPNPSSFKELLKNDDKIRKGECEVETPPIPTDLNPWQSRLTMSWDNYYAIIHAECAKMTKELIDPSNIATLFSPQPKTTELESTGIPARIIAAEKKIKDSATDAERVTAKKELETAQNDLEKAKFEDNAHTTHLKIEEICKFTATDLHLNKSFTEVEDKFKTDLKVKFDKIATAEEKVKDKFGLYNTTNNDATKLDWETAIADLKKAKEEYETEQKVTEKLILEYKKKMQNYIANVISATDAIKSWVKVKNVDKPPKFVAPPHKTLSDILPIEQQYNNPDPLPPTKSCEPLPTVQVACKSAKPDLERACHFLRAIIEDPAICQNDETDSTTLPKSELVKDLIGAEFVEIIDLIEEIFAQACKRLDAKFAKRINRVFKCYLLKPEKNGGAGFDIRTPKPGRDISFKGVWPQLKQALVTCKYEKKRLMFKRDPNDSDKNKVQLLLRNATGIFPKDIHLHQEQADLQFPFNFAIDMHFKMFATVMGICMASETYVSRNSFLTPAFFAKYTDLFFTDLEREWTDPRDNLIFNKILGNYKKRGGKFWANRCMEASFITSEDTNYRPPRKLFVNSRTEGNYFITGKLANTQGMYTF